MGHEHFLGIMMVWRRRRWPPVMGTMAAATGYSDIGEIVVKGMGGTHTNGEVGCVLLPENGLRP